MIVVDLSKIPLEGEVLDAAFEPAALSLMDTEFRLTAPVTLEGRIQAVESANHNAFRLQGMLEATVQVDCVRCLEPTLLGVQEQLELIYVSEAQNVAREDVEDEGLQGDELAVSYYSQDKIDLRQMIHEQLLLALPMKPLCEENCQGLCPECRKNRNETPCGCEPVSVGIGFSNLKDLLKF